MKNAETIVAEILELTKQLGALAEQDPKSCGVITFAMANGKLHVGVAGAPPTLSEVIALAMLDNGDIKDVVEVAAEAVARTNAEAAPSSAGLRAILTDLGLPEDLVNRMASDADTCGCDTCVARRAKRANPYIN